MPPNTDMLFFYDETLLLTKVSAKDMSWRNEANEKGNILDQFLKIEYPASVCRISGQPLIINIPV